MAADTENPAPRGNAAAVDAAATAIVRKISETKGWGYLFIARELEGYSDPSQWLYDEFTPDEVTALVSPHLGPLYQSITGVRYKADAPDSIRISEWVTGRMAEMAGLLAHGVDEEGMTRTVMRRALYPSEFDSLSNVEETSWGNDTADSIMFEVEGEPFRMFVDLEHPEDRNDEDGGVSRFTIYTDDASEGKVAFETDSVAEAREWAIAARNGEIIEQE